MSYPVSSSRLHSMLPFHFTYLLQYVNFKRAKQLCIDDIISHNFRGIQILNECRGIMSFGGVYPPQQCNG